MTDQELIELVRDNNNFIIFRGLNNDRVISNLTKSITYLCGEDRDINAAMDCYCEFIAALYPDTDDLTDYILKRMLENDNLYVRKFAEGKPTGTLLNECLANELWTLEKLAELPCYELLDRMDNDGFMPRYNSHRCDFSEIYALRLKDLHHCGYGVYSQYIMFAVENAEIVPIKHPDPIRLSDFSGYERERGEVIDNTLALLAGKPANNVLLYGDCGTGKSSCVKAIANEYAKDGLRLIELKKKQLHELPQIVGGISRNPLKFIIFIDDLSFTEDDDDFAALKAILEGSASTNAANICIYATSNRRHLVRETFSARRGDEIHAKDTMQELLSLSDRFGLTVTFVKPDKQLYLSVVEDLARKYKLKMPMDEIKKQAETFALSRAGRSPRVAKQFVEYLKGMEED